jgi:rubrerythrin
MDKQVLKAVKLALALERKELEYYKLASGKTSNPNGRRVFSFLAEEEEKHLKALKRQLESAQEKGSWLTDEELFDRKACRIKKKTPKDFTPNEVKPDTGDVEALEEAISIEKKSIAFYEDAACRLSDEKALKVFHYLIDAEKEHLRELKMQHAFLKSEGVWYDNELTLS